MVATAGSKDRFLLIVDTLFQQLLAVFVLLILWEVFKVFSFDNKHAWHVVLCTLGFALFTAESLLLFNKENSFLKDVERTTRGTIHGVLTLVALVCITAGVALKITQKDDAELKHFTTTHGIIGLVAWMLTFISVVLGIIAGSASRYAKLGKPALYRMVHLIIGVVTYIMGVVALGFGLHYLEPQTGVHGRNALIVFLSLYVGYSLVGPIKSCFNYFFG